MSYVLQSVPADWQMLCTNFPPLFWEQESRPMSAGLYGTPTALPDTRDRYGLKPYIVRRGGERGKKSL